MTCRTVPLLSPNVPRESWNEGMAPEEYAVHYSVLPEDTGVPSCTVCDSLHGAEAHAREQVALHPGLRCRIYGRDGFVGAPVLEIVGSRFKGESDLSPRLRRWSGGALLFGGAVLVGVDWSTGFRLSWPGLIGSRLLIPGFALLVTEALLLVHAKQKRLDLRRLEAHKGEAG